MFPQIFGKYVLEREIAAGGMARVYLATLRGAVGFEKRLVVKQIRAELASDPAFVRRFVDEAKTAVELNHPNIVPVYELGVEQGVYFIAMELCEGLTLAEVLAETGPLSPEEGAYLGVSVCRALDYAHRRAGIVHRDVTPRNVLIDDEGAIRLIDFGIAAPAEVEDGQPKSGRVEVFGSPGHMPPEQLRGATLTPASDVFAVGALLIEAWTGRPPFRRATARESERALSVVPERLDAHEPRFSPIGELIARSVALEVGERPERAELLSRPMRQFLKHTDSGDVERRLGARVRRARRRMQSSNPWLGGEGLSTLTDSNAESEPVELAPIAATPPITRTFAAREDVVEWTQRLSSLPPSGAPEPSNAEPSKAEPSNAEPFKAEPSNAGVRGPETRPLSSPPPSPPPPEAGSSSDSPALAQARPARRARVLAPVLLFAALLIGLVWARAPRVSSPPAQSARGSAEPDQGGSAELRASLTPAPPTPASGPPSAQSPEPPAPRAPDEPPRPKHPDPLAATSSGKPEKAANGKPERSDPARTSFVKLTAVPEASVTIGGRILNTPVARLELAPGAYLVTFRNAIDPAPVSTRVSLGPGEHKSVHADFTAASPRVVVY